jgi:hypothetical protein
MLSLHGNGYSLGGLLGSDNTQLCQSRLVFWSRTLHPFSETKCTWRGTGSITYRQSASEEEEVHKQSLMQGNESGQESAPSRGTLCCFVVGGK